MSLCSAPAQLRRCAHPTAAGALPPRGDNSCGAPRAWAPLLQAQRHAEESASERMMMMRRRGCVSWWSERRNLAATALHCACCKAEALQGQRRCRACSAARCAASAGRAIAAAAEQEAAVGSGLDCGNGAHVRHALKVACPSAHALACQPASQQLTPPARALLSTLTVTPTPKPQAHHPRPKHYVQAQP